MKVSLFKGLVVVILVGLGISPFCLAGPNPSPERLLGGFWGLEPLSNNSRLDTKCREAYDRIFADGTLEVLIVFGYKDARPARFVGDRHERLLFVQSLLRPCETGFHACGFRRSLRDGNLFMKRIEGPQGRKVKVLVRVVNSSSGPDDEENRLDPFQSWMSLAAEKAFLEGLRRADVVFYNGHSRGGGGPDFFPPKLLQSSEEVDYNFYAKNQPGLMKLLSHLNKKSSEGVQLLGLFSCTSSQHFSQAVRKKKPALGLISSSQLLYYAEAFENSLAALSALLEMRCEKEFKAAIRHESLQQGSQLTGFFVE